MTLPMSACRRAEHQYLGRKMRELLRRYGNSILWCLLVFFFFQAEDGIRDLIVTGVQTCALPIYAQDGLFTLIERGLSGGAPLERIGLIGAISRALAADDQWNVVRDVAARPEKIGRASCRERV